jgi:hypothetical protein
MILRWAALIAIAVVLAGCPKKIAYKPYLPEQYRGGDEDPEPTLPGIFTGRDGKYVIYGR